MLKKSFVVSMTMLIAAAIGYAANPFDNFNSQLTIVGQAQDIAQSKLDNFAKDLGVVMGAGSYHQAEALGLLGFDVGVQVPVQKTSDGDTIVKSAGLDTIALPVLQVEKGLPAKIDLIGRFTSYTDASMYGVGLRYGILKSAVPGIPSISVQAVYNKLDVNSSANKLSATAITGDAIASISLPIVTPYIGIGIIQTDVTPDSTITNLKGSAQSTHIEGGVNLSLIPFTYIRLGAMIVDGSMSYDGGLGVKF